MLNLESVYGAKVTLKNFAVGGTDTAWGLASIGKVIEADTRPGHPGLWHERLSAGRPTA